MMIPVILSPSLSILYRSVIVGKNNTFPYPPLSSSLSIL